jgi:lysophospholipase L1-like esterase
MSWDHKRFGRRATLLRLLGLAALVAGLVGAGAPRGARAQSERPVIDPQRVGYPRSMAALGDSITRAFLSKPGQIDDAPENSWATGTAAAVNSHYTRTLAMQPAIAGKNYNFAVSGAKMSALAGQVTQAISVSSEYVTILMGANDVCALSEASMTPVATFRTQFSDALTALSAGLPDARILVVGVPDVYKVWEVAHGESQAQTIWTAFQVCQTMFQNPASTAAAAVERRARVRQRNLDYNTQLAEVCAQFIHCRYSAALAASTFQLTDLAEDYYHPSIAGQAKLAAATYTQGFNFSDMAAPVSTARSSRAAGGMYQISISATDNAGVAGIEYRLGAGPWQRYQSPLTVANDAQVIYRAVDINGNIEGSRMALILTRHIFLPFVTRSATAPAGQAAQIVYSAIMRTIVRSLS